ncbi:MAG: helicase-exonuclease AddAB subunit AddA [Oscillospiraceae bacterium]|nr:helicase-exonuclease AddAB subunit AddA [Oscillospiraceae bacterium]
MAFPLTDEQRRAVENRGGALLVSAAAGSGKTRVLVERLLDRVSRGADIDRFLVITYTKAAAAELRGRIAKELNERLAEQPGDRHLCRQAALIYRAHISTVHSFCANLLREHAAALDLDPDFRLCDEGEAVILMDQVLSRLMDDRYENLDSAGDFAQLVDTLSAGRDDRRLMQIVLDVFRRIQSHPDPEAWLSEQERVWQLDDVSDVAQTPWGRLLVAQAHELAEYNLRRLRQAERWADMDPVLSMNYGDSIRASIAAVRQLLHADSWDGIRAALPVPFPTAGRKQGVENGEAAARAKALRERAKTQLNKLNDWFVQDSESLLTDLRLARPAVRELVALVRDFGRAFAEEKRRRGLLDFADLEHMAVRLLVDDAGRPTDVARTCGARFDEVMVDEFQDTNRVQTAIFDAVSDGGRSLFMVGDVKQSIYRFRLADPTIFLERYRDYAPADEAANGEGRKLVLSRNFRSRPQVLEGVNDLFRDIMSVPLGEMEYTDDQALVPGRKTDEPGDWAVELDVVLTDSDEEDEDERADKNLLEARNAAARVRQLLDGMRLSEGEGDRPLRPEDVMILMRSPGPVLHHYIRALEEQGIPWSADTGEDFFSFTEINVALALLRVVDNPRQDVALISALRSPVYSFTADRLAQLRAESRGDFFTAVEEAAARGEQDCADVIRELDVLRTGAADRSCSELIWHIYERTNLLGLFSAMPEGDRRRGHLLSLYELARQQEGAGCRTLFDFLLRLDRLRDSGQNVFKGSAPNENGGVRILTIHRSKGLEAPVVLVCGLGRQFNRTDLYNPVLFHQTLGIGLRYVDRERNIELDTLSRHAVARVLDNEMLAEELRLLYVAMTRARDKLILSVSGARLGKALADAWGELDSPIPPQLLAGCSNVGMWVLMSAMTRRCGEPLRKLAGLDNFVDRDYTIPWDVRVIDGESLAGFRSVQAQTRRQEQKLDEDALRAAYDWSYPYRLAGNTPSKLTATQLKGRDLDREVKEEGEPREKSGSAAPLYRPRFAAEKLGLTPAQKGTATHLVMQYLDFARCADAGQIAEQITKLVEREFISEQEGQAVDPGRLAAFFQTPLGHQMRETEVNREFKFSLLVDAGDYYPGLAGEELLLQGVVDGWFETAQGITVVDFKSDRVTEQTVAERAAQYKPQLDTYAKALNAITGRPVTRRVLWFFALDRAVEV